ncbi:DUF2625 domain-containing protein [Hymenobacter sp. BT559]|uniref:DUF2625 domain-containing protein n=1 Tax=Hymenobacter sp. BT559 TaxID=2795729 RepID=UPI0018EA92F6|nr:DUF2625 domain-containing protein [Hymenobacter sp. BT559]MBJ6141899.1 DUF2625 domain-containing protein [Hymenobacter sp. BT559]
MKRTIGTLCLLAAAVINSPTPAHAQQMPMRSLAELINTQEPGWELVSGWLKQAKNKVQVLPKSPMRADSALLAAQVTTRSPMGAVIYETGGILVDNGWLRILGSGNQGLDRDLMSWNKHKQQGFLLVADDVLGGFYAINAGAFGLESMGKIFYFAPESLRWQATGKTYSDFLVFCFSGNLSEFYHGLRWKGWEQEISALTGNQGIACYPFLFTKEGKNIAKNRRGVVPMAELWTFGQSMQQQLNGKH